MERGLGVLQLPSSVQWVQAAGKPRFSRGAEQAEHMGWATPQALAGTAGLGAFLAFCSATPRPFLAASVRYLVVRALCVWMTSHSAELGRNVLPADTGSACADIHVLEQKAPLFAFLSRRLAHPLPVFITELQIRNLIAHCLSDCVIKVKSCK